MKLNQFSYCLLLLIGLIVLPQETKAMQQSHTHSKEEVTIIADSQFSALTALPHSVLNFIIALLPPRDKNLVAQISRFLRKLAIDTYSIASLNPFTVSSDQSRLHCIKAFQRKNFTHCKTIIEAGVLALDQELDCDLPLLFAGKWLQQQNQILPEKEPILIPENMLLKDAEFEEYRANNPPFYRRCLSQLFLGDISSLLPKLNTYISSHTTSNNTLETLHNILYYAIIVNEPEVINTILAAEQIKTYGSFESGYAKDKIFADLLYHSSLNNTIETFKTICNFVLHPQNPTKINYEDTVEILIRKNKPNFVETLLSYYDNATGTMNIQQLKKLAQEQKNFECLEILSQLK